jgi:hypothetical protein
MRKTNKARNILRMAAIGLVALGFAAAGGGPALAADVAVPAVTVSPSEDLVDGQEVAVSATGFNAGEDLFVAECAVLNEQLACNVSEAVPVTTDETGGAAAKVVVRRTFAAVSPDGTPVGDVDCTTVPVGCAIIAGVDPSRFAHARISFA